MSDKKKKEEKDDTLNTDLSFDQLLSAAAYTKPIKDNDQGGKKEKVGSIRKTKKGT